MAPPRGLRRRRAGPGRVRVQQGPEEGAAARSPLGGRQEGRSHAREALRPCVAELRGGEQEARGAVQDWGRRGREHCRRRGGNGTGGFHGESSSSLSNPASSNDGFFPPALLSTTANRLTLADVERAGNEARGYALCLVDVEPRADLSYLLRRFAESGLLKAIEGPDERGSATVRFTKAAGLREALDQLGGGMRGAFRIDRTATLRANEAVLGIPATSSAAAAAAPAGAAPAPPSSIYSDLDPHDRMAAIEAAFSSTSVSGSRGGARSNANARGGGGGGPSSSSSGNVNNASFRPSAAAVAAAAAELGNGWKLASDFDWADDE